MTRTVALFAALLLCACCAELKPSVRRGAGQKIEIDLTRIDADGLRGPPDGKVAVAYEFCIPNTDACKNRVRAIDGTVQFMPGSRGRIGAARHQCLCIGSTHQERFREVLQSLAQLPCVDRIIECHFE